MESENRHEFDVTLGTFEHPRYEIIPTGRGLRRRGGGDGYFHETRAAFPDQRNELIALHHADDAVIVEFWLLRHARGRVPRRAADRQGVQARMPAIFEFEGEGSCASASTSTPRRSCGQLGLRAGLGLARDRRERLDGALVLRRRQADVRLLAHRAREHADRLDRGRGVEVGTTSSGSTAIVHGQRGCSTCSGSATTSTTANTRCQTDA